MAYTGSSMGAVDTMAASSSLRSQNTYDYGMDADLYNIDEKHKPQPQTLSRAPNRQQELAKKRVKWRSANTSKQTPLEFLCRSKKSGS